MPRLMPTTTTATLARGATEDTTVDTPALDTTVDTPALDTLDLDTPALDTLDLDTLDLATAVATPDLGMEATPVATMASVRPRPSPRLMPTTETATLDSATDTAVATDTTDKKVPVLHSTKAFKTSVK